MLKKKKKRMACGVNGQRQQTKIEPVIELHELLVNLGD